MPRPPRKKIPFQPAGTRVNLPAPTAASDATKIASKNTRTASQLSRVAKKLSPSTRSAESRPRNSRASNGAAKASSSEVEVEVQSSDTKKAGTTIEHSRTRAKGRTNSKQKQLAVGRLSTGSLQRRSSARVASSISPEESMVQEPTNNISYDTEEASSTIERVGDSFPTFATAPASRRPSMSRPPTAPPSAIKPAATPSFLGNFKRRARQPSILRMVQQQSDIGSISPSEEGNTTYFSLDRSIVSQPRRESGPTETTSSASRKRKRSSIVHVDEETLAARSSSPLVDSIPSDPAELPGLEGDIQIPATAQEDDEPSLPLHEQYPQSPSPDPSPATSDLAAAFTAQRNRTRRTTNLTTQSRPSRTARPTTTPVRAISLSPMTTATSPLSIPSSSPIQHQQALQHKRQKRDQPAARPLRTADLQTLLPQRRTIGGRRTRRRYAEDEFDILESSSAAGEPSSEIAAESEGEDSGMWPARGRRRTGAASAVKKGGLSALKGRGGVKRAAPTPLRGKGTMYSRRVSEYEGNEDGEDAEEPSVEVLVQTGASGGADVAASAELQAAAVRFKEVDEWELSFESCDANGGGDSSPWR
ncbi:hypothetical protein FH972_023810 [Carpinus fangiana]|uniref:Uncharacterized protein n=1 Tax=Carpinus fangiana TaxID=176857 RepID=A0A5N6KWI3_9ROSI|nr:hypothetical protein FH972_023810 [Carpinus fangiana]